MLIKSTMEDIEAKIAAESVDEALGPMFVTLEAPKNAKKKNLKVVEEFERGRYKVTVYSYKVTNYGYTMVPLNDSNQN